MALSTAGLKSGLNSGSKSIDGFKNKVSSAGQSVSGLGSSAASAGSILSSFALPALGALAAVGIAIKGVQAGISAIAFPISLAAEMEQTAVSFKVLLGSADQAKIVMEDLKQFAASTPFEFPELAKAGKQLVAFGVTGKDLIPTLNKLGDVSAGIGIPIGELSEIYGKAKVQGRLFMEDINQLQGRGINVTSQLAKQFGVTEEAVRGLVSSGKVNFGNLEKAFTSMTGKGGQFEGMMKEQSGTMSGLWSTAKDNVMNVLTKIGEGIIKAFNLKGVLNRLIAWGDSMTPVFEKWISNIQKVFAALAPYIMELFNGISDALAPMTAVWTDLFSFFFINTEKGIDGFIENIRSMFETLVPTIISYYKTFAKLWTAASKVLAFGFKVVGVSVNLVLKSVLLLIDAFNWIAGIKIDPKISDASKKIQFQFDRDRDKEKNKLFDGDKKSPLSGIGQADQIKNGIDGTKNIDGISQADQIKNIPIVSRADQIKNDIDGTNPIDLNNIAGTNPIDLKNKGDSFAPYTGGSQAEDIKNNIDGTNAEDTKYKLAGAAEKGSREARQSILNFEMGGSKGKDPIEELAKKQLTEQQKGNGLLAKISSKKDEVLAF